MARHGHAGPALPQEAGPHPVGSWDRILGRGVTGQSALQRHPSGGMEEMAGRQVG